VWSVAVEWSRRTAMTNEAVRRALADPRLDDGDGLRQRHSVVTQRHR